MFQIKLGKNQEREKQTLIDDACILASRARCKGNYDQTLNYNNMLNFVEGSLNQRAMIMFLKSYPDAYLQDERARKVVDAFIENNSDNAYGLHAEALKLYYLEKDEFKQEHDLDLMQTIASKNKYLKAFRTCDMLIKRYKATPGETSEFLVQNKQKEANKNYTEAYKLQRRLASVGWIVELAFNEASNAYKRLAGVQDKHDALMSEKERVSITHMLGNGDASVENALCNRMNKATRNNFSIENQYAYYTLGLDLGKLDCLSAEEISFQFTVMGVTPISKEGNACITLGGKLIADAENQDAPVSE